MITKSFQLLLVILAPTLSASQIPFSTPVRPPSVESSFNLQHAIHFNTDRSLSPLIKEYTPTTLQALDSNLYSISPIKTVKTKAWQPNSNVAFQSARRASYFTPRALRSGHFLNLDQLQDSIQGSLLEWNEVEIDMPDVTDVKTVAALGKMTANAYTLPDDSAGWFNMNGTWNLTDSFGWLEDGLRGHIFANPDNSTIVVSIKGTSAGLIGGSGTTGRNDKINDNLLFSCCCARVDWSWSTVCDCYDKGYTCKQDCIEEAVMEGSAYYPIATDLYNNITALYPHAQIWLTGHSLGGGLSAMLSHTYGVPSVSFESPGDLLPAKRLHLPLPPAFSSHSQTNLTTHVYHTADPIAMGVCNGALSTCAVAGFALESRCHSGKSIIYDTVGLLNWSVDIRTHSIRSVIQYLLVEEWVPRKKSVSSGRGWGWWPGKGKGDDKEEEPDYRSGKEGKGVPEAESEEDCIDCFRWTYV